MSQSTAVRIARPATRPAARPGAPRLRAVTAPVGARSRAGLVMGCLGLLAVGLVGLLLLTMSLEKGAFVLRRQQAEIERLLDQKQALTEELAARGAPQSLAVRAAQLGMVPAPNAAFVRPSDGQVFGEPLRAVAQQSQSATIREVPASGRGTSAGPAASPSPTVGTTAGKAKAPAKVTVTPKAAATTTSGPGTPAGRRTGGAASAPSRRASATAGRASTRAGTAVDAPAQVVTRKPVATAAGTS